MSRSVDYVVDVEASLEEASVLAERVVRELVQRGIVLPTPEYSELHGAGSDYATGPNASEAATGTLLDRPLQDGQFPCGLETHIGHEVYPAGEFGLDTLECPRCRHAHQANDLPWQEAVDEWYEASGPALLGCPSCGQSSQLTDWRFKPAWAFGNLAFCFNEWRLKPEFVDQLTSLLGHRTVWVQSRW
ncbi:MAG: hypothetical protein ACREHD_01770 [Pirellulales bacterium]